MTFSSTQISELISIFDEEFGIAINYSEAEDIGKSLFVVFEALSRCKNDPI